MLSTYFYKDHPKVTTELEIKADRVTFEDGWVIFWEVIKMDAMGRPLSRIIQAIHREACYNLREVVNE